MARALLLCLLIGAFTPLYAQVSAQPDVRLHAFRFDPSARGGIVFGQAVNQPRRVQAEESVPFLVTEVDGKPAWKLRGTVEISLEELVTAWVRSSGNALVTSPMMLKATATYQAPAEGVTLTGEKMTEFVSDMLAQFKLALVGFSVGRAQIVFSVEACSVAPVVDSAKLATVPGTEWVTWHCSLRYADANAMRAALQNLVSRQGGVVNPLQGCNGLTITDRAERVRQLARLCAGLDVPATSERTLESYELPESLKPDDVAASLRGLLKPAGSGAPRAGNEAPEISVVPGRNRLVVRGTAAHHADVKRALELMK